MSMAKAGKIAPKAIVFDLDGTLVDSAPEIATALNSAMAEIGQPPFPLSEVQTFIGSGAKVTLQRALAARGTEIDEAVFDGMMASFYKVYAAVSEAGSGLYPGVTETLIDLRKRGIPLGVCTNKAEHITSIALRALGIESFFTVVVGARDDLPRKPAPDMLLAALNVLGAMPARHVPPGVHLLP
jgi:phosphoglycolate phosphatase